MEAVAGLVPPTECLADIGTDHALLPIHLVKHGVVSRVIAVEKAVGPAAAARRAVAAAGLEDRIEVRRGEGLGPLAAGEAGAIVLAGMGGQTIADILAAGTAVARAAGLIVVQPMNRIAFLRRWLVQNGWVIRAEALAAEKGRLYQVVAAAPGSSRKQLNWLEEELGPCLLASRPPFFKELVGKVLRRYEQEFTGLAGAREGGAADRRAELAQRLEELRGLLKR
ncbi:MAG: class I SAM-dependent methyltransferase [Bacillota bacterium]